MAGDTPSRKRRFRRKNASEAYQSGPGPAEGVTPPAEHSALLPHPGVSDDDGRGLPASLAAAQGDHDGPVTGARGLGKVKRGIQKGGASARAGLAHLADRIIDNAPRVPVRDLATLRRQFPGLGPEELADKLVAGAANSSSTVGAGIGAVAMMPVPPAMPAELAAEITAVAAIELKLIAELHEVYGLRPPGNLKQRSTAYLTSWTEERGVDIMKPHEPQHGALGPDEARTASADHEAHHPQSAEPGAVHDRSGRRRDDEPPRHPEGRRAHP